MTSPQMSTLGSGPVRHFGQRKVLTVGDGASGKTSLLLCYVHGTFPEQYEPTVFETYVKSVVLPDNSVVELSLWDTAGQEDFDRLRSLSYADTNIVVLCFSVDNPVSLQNVADRWLPEIQEHSPGTPIVLVALKCDLRQDPHILSRLAERGMAPIQYDAGLQAARQIRAVAYLECSAKYNRGVAEVFNEVARLSVSKGKGGGHGGGGGGAGGGGDGLRKMCGCVIL
ncbi:Rho GTPase [Tilletia horrida]|uniref:Rho GTPase n=1 Tax=Tilletia horrida TaxID=155126 RepID=A0AAN6GBL6_9BASI|nr:Rho GTPase [Tilletia horrida]KAK0535445.1 Rho GTPase [Tilletia horrida]